MFAPAIFFFVIMESTSVLCISKAVDASGARIYNSATVVLIQEVLKLVVSLIGLWYEDPGFVTFKRHLAPTALLKSSIPAMLYAVNNNIFLVVLTLINPSVFQLMLNMRVVWTGLIFRFILGRPVTKKQWLALIILVFGCSIAQTATSVTSAGDSSATGLGPETFSDYLASIDPKVLLGFALTMVYTVVSTTAGVVNEVVLKSGESFHSSNVKLYFFGVVFNIFALYYQGSSAAGGFFRGWEHPIVWVITGLMATIGMLVAKIMQKYDNIVKIFCVAAANFVVYSYSVAKDGYPLSAGFIVAFFMVSTAAYLYQREKNRVDAASKTIVTDTSNGRIQTTSYAKVGETGEELTMSDVEIDDFEDTDFDEGPVQGMQLKIMDKQE
jgi:UDP-sugar transporter A1/2/3